MKLSIITITYRDLPGLRKTWESIRYQTFRDWEWIVVDGGSGPEVETFLSENNSEIAYWCSEPDKGIYNAMNKGIAKAKGERLLFLNSADTLADNGILQKVFSENHDADVLYGDTFYDRPNGLKYEPYPEHLTMEHFMQHSICHQSSFIRRELLVKTGYDESLRIVADWKRFMEMFVEGCTFHHLNYAVSIYDTKGISTNSIDKCNSERDRVLKGMFPPRVLESLWNSAISKAPETRRYMEKRWLYKRIVRSVLHLIRWMDSL